MPNATQDRVRNRRKLMQRLPIPHETLMGRAGPRPDRARWHILDDNYEPLCRRINGWEIVDQEQFSAVVTLRGLVCNPCHGKFSWRPMPHEYVLEDHGYTTPCKVWPRGVDTPGYAIRGRPNQRGNFSVHREAYEQTYGEIPDGHVIHHLCENKLCLEPSHMEAMSRADHLRLHRIWEHRNA